MGKGKENSKLALANAKLAIVETAARAFHPGKPQKGVWFYLVLVRLTDGKIWKTHCRGRKPPTLAQLASRLLRSPNAWDFHSLAEPMKPAPKASEPKTHGGQHE